MLKQVLLIGAAAISFPALAQNTPPADTTAPPPTEQADPSAGQPAPTPAEPAPADTTAPAPTDAPATAPADSASPAPAEPAAPAGDASKAAAATPAQIAQIVDTEFPTYDGDKNGDLNQTEFASWMKKLRAATEPTIDTESEQVKTWIGQTWAAADADKSGAVSKEELTGFLSRGA